MKNKYLYLAIVLFAVLVSCKKESSDVTPKKMGATVDGQTWEASVRVTTLTNGIFVITGTSSDSKAIAVTINGETTGTYALSVLPVKTECGATYTPSIFTPSNTYASATGKVVLTKVDKVSKTISGTFEFTVVSKDLTKTITIKSGEFNDLIYE